MAALAFETRADWMNIARQRRYALLQEQKGRNTARAVFSCACGTIHLVMAYAQFTFCPAFFCLFHTRRSERTALTGKKPRLF